MTAAIISFPTNWQKFPTPIATTGGVVGWEMKIGDLRANILKNEGLFFWRVYARIKHRKPTPHQRFRPLGDWTSSPSLFVAMAAAKEIASLTR